MTKNELHEVISSIVEELRAYNGFMDLTDPEDQPRLGPPASEQDIQQLQQARSHPLPPSYINLLKICDGIERFYMVNGDLYSTRYLIANPAYASVWRRPGRFFFVIDQDWNAVAFDLSTATSEGEMEVQEYEQNSEGARWLSLGDFLHAYLGRLHEWNAVAKADREGVDE